MRNTRQRFHRAWHDDHGLTVLTAARNLRAEILVAVERERPVPDAFTVGRCEVFGELVDRRASRRARRAAAAARNLR